MINSVDLATDFFSSADNDPRIVDSDLQNLVAAKLGSTVATMFFTSRLKKEEALSAQEIFDDDEDLTVTGPKYKKLPAAKKVQTNENVLAYLKDNIEFMMLSKSGYEKDKTQLRVLVQAMDPSTRLLFAQNITSMNTNEGNSMMELLFDVFEQELIDMLDLSESTRKMIIKS